MKGREYELDKIDREKTGLNIKRMIKENGMSQSQLAKIIDADELSVSRWVNGKVLPNAFAIMKLEELFKCKAKDILVLKE